MCSSTLTASDQQLSALSCEGEDVSVPVDIFDTYTHTSIHTHLPHAPMNQSNSPFKGNVKELYR